MCASPYSTPALPPTNQPPAKLDPLLLHHLYHLYHHRYFSRTADQRCSNFPTSSPPSTKDTVASDPLPRLLNVTLNGGGGSSSSNSSRGSSSQQSISNSAVTQSSKTAKTTTDALTSPPSPIATATTIPTTGQIPLVYRLIMLRETVIYIAFAILWLFGYARVSFLSFRRNLSRLRPCPLSFLCRPQCLICGF